MICIIRDIIGSFFSGEKRDTSDARPSRYIRHLFDFKKRVYLDHNATTNVSKPVRKIMDDVLKSCHGNPSSSYGIARQANEIISIARQQVATAVNADAHEIYFTGSATESNNMVLKSVSSCYFPKKNKIISTPIEHPSVLQTLEYLQTQGIIVEYCPVDKWGRVIIEKLIQLIDERTFLICCMLANNEIGTIQDIPKIVQIAQKHGVLLFSDCVQAFGKIPVDLHRWGVDYATFSAHKLYGPKGTGALFVKNGCSITPLIHGGHQEQNIRAGTECVHNIAGFGEACKNVPRLLSQQGVLQNLKKMFTHKIKEVQSNCVINSPEEYCLPNTINVTFPGVKNSELIAVFDYHGVAVSPGSACSSLDEKPSRTLKAIGLSDTAAKETIRFSMGSETSINDIRYTVKVLRDFVHGKTQFVNIISPVKVDEQFIFNDQNYILDVRPQMSRRMIKSIPNSHEISFFSMEKYLNQIPGNKNILVVCHGGDLSYVAGLFLKAKGYAHVGSLENGINGWKLIHGDLYQKYSGQNVTVLNHVRH